MSIRKCLLVGDGGTGKTSLMRRLVTGEFSTAYSATVGYEIHRLSIRPVSSKSSHHLHVWDVSGQSSSGRLLNEILNGAHCAIILFDVMSRITFCNVLIWYRDIVNVCGPEIPIVVLGNKIDMPARKIKPGLPPMKLPSSVKYYEMSVKTKFNVEEPIQWIAGKLLNSSSKIIIEPPVSSKDPEIWNNKLQNSARIEKLPEKKEKKKAQDKPKRATRRKQHDASNNPDVKK